MKKRYSIEKNEYSNERENGYKEKCYDIAYALKRKLKYEEGAIYIQNENKNFILLCEPLQPKTLWYETWMKLNNI